jgi:DHA1 family tetracycline resistance protein-like MFS transporter
MSLTTILGPPLMNNLFKFFTTSQAPVYFPGAAFLLGAVFMIGSALVAWLTLRSEKHAIA